MGCARAVSPPSSPVPPIAGAILSLKITPREKSGSVAGPPWWHAEGVASFLFWKDLHHEVGSRSRSSLWLLLYPTLSARKGACLRYVAYRKWKRRF